MEKKNIVILGGGFGGLQSALKLSKKINKSNLKEKYQIILIDKHDYHTFTPLLYEIATTSKETAEYQELKNLVAYKFKDLLKNKNINFIQDEVKNIDVKNNKILLKEKTIDFNYLILALGSETNYFQIPGVKENALNLKTFDDAVIIRNKISFTVKNSDKKEIDVIIGGGGSTGVELAGEIREWTCQLEEQENCKTNIHLIQGGSDILPGFNEKIIKKAKKRLKDLGVKISTNKFIKKVDKKEITLSNESKISYDVLIWTAGVKAADISKKLPAKKNKLDRIEVIGNLECVPNDKSLNVYGNIYAIGDISCIYDPESGDPTPLVARAAIEQGRISAYNVLESIRIEEEIKKQKRLKEYKYKKYPYIVPVGGKYAIAKIGPIVLSGFLAWSFKGIVELNYFLSIMPPLKAFKIWLKGLKVFIKNDRLG